eukprot:Polyplicarium_translucidae@DN2318_c0_g1_i4.p1
MISSVLIANRKGEILVYRAYRGDVSRHETHLFCQRVIAGKEASERPVQCIGMCSFLHVSVADVVFVATTRANLNATMGLVFLYKFINILRSYFGGTVDENNVRKNFVLAYELLDEVADFGYPQILEPEVLKKYITQGGQKLPNLNDEAELRKITIQATGSTSWRAEGIKYRKNEVYIDIVESVNVLVSQKGHVLRSDVSGRAIVRCLLSGMPECKFGVNDKLVMNKLPQPPKGVSSAARGISIDDVRFHQCVKLSKFDSERTVTFIPPDGTFELMSYRISENIQLPFRVLPVLQERGRTKLDFSLKAKTTFARNLYATNVAIKIPVPKNAAGATISSISMGKAKLEVSQEAVVWRIRRFPGETEHTLLVEVDLAPSITDVKWTRPPISVDFQIPMYTASGLCVRFLRIQEKSNFKPVKWIRYITRAGSYQHRI